MRRINQAMILAAGLGSRMGDLTKNIPKPMVAINEISLIEKILTYLQLNGINKVVINTYYKGEMLKNFVQSLSIAQNMEIYFSQEEELLGGGGGVKNALHFFGNKPFFTLNSDAIFVDDDLNKSSLDQLEVSWNPNFTSWIMLLVRKSQAFGYSGEGDFNLGLDGMLNQDTLTKEFIYSGMSIMDYRLFEGYLENKFELSLVFKNLMHIGKLYGVIYSGKWYHVGDAKSYADYVRDHV